MPILKFLPLFFLFARFSDSQSFLSENMFESRGYTGRTLLQAKKNCPANFEVANFTIVTSQCKGPKYEASLCCGALKMFACPYAEALNDLTNDCATIMFSYLNLYGKYPPGLFSSECREGKDGLTCPVEPPTIAPINNFGTRINYFTAIAIGIPMLVGLMVFNLGW